MKNLKKNKKEVSMKKMKADNGKIKWNGDTIEVIMFRTDENVVKPIEIIIMENDINLFAPFFYYNDGKETMTRIGLHVSEKFSWDIFGDFSIDMYNTIWEKILDFSKEDRTSNELIDFWMELEKEYNEILKKKNKKEVSMKKMKEMLIEEKLRLIRNINISSIVIISINLVLIIARFLLK